MNQPSNRLRLSLDHTGSRIILHYALDTSSVKTDSILTWLGHMDTYDADLQLARHYFFTGNYTAADNLLQAIPSTYDLDGDLLAEFDDIVAVLQLVRPRLQTGVPLGALPGTLVDSLATIWGAECTAAGALARNILYRNGLRMEADCGETVPRVKRKYPGKTIEGSSQSLQIFPNPARSAITIQRKNAESEALIRISDVGFGRTYLEQLLSAGETSTTIDILRLVNGVYILSLLENGVTAGQVKLIVTH